VAKGRQARGERNGRAKLQRVDAEEIRAMFAAGDISKMALGRRFGIDRKTVGLIVRGAR